MKIIENKNKEEELTVSYNDSTFVPSYFLKFYIKDLGPIVSMAIIYLMYLCEYEMSGISYASLANKIGVPEKILFDSLHQKNLDLFIKKDGQNLMLNKMLWKEIRSKTIF
jgi:hypothetical protein